MPNEFHPGQRWVSESEPELGLGSVLHVTDRTVTIIFRASDQTRAYARSNAPLRRVRFRVGDTIWNHTGTPLAVQSVIERDRLLFYCGRGKEVCETELSDASSFNKPEERLLTGHVDPPHVFNLRVAALARQHLRRKSRVRGFVGGRIDLIAHQLYIASEVAGRLVPRVLLADEVGLGKTIEACLILHRLILTGRARRVLILVPESLVHQWFVELLRRFNLWFHIFDEERCEAIESASPEDNPFLDGQLVLCNMRLFTDKEERVRQALAAGWDILVVDEAHHLTWSPDAVSPEYALVEALCEKTPGLLLLTATPEQLGMAGHFARLRLLDPDRFFELKEFIKETEHYRDIAQISEKVLGNRQFTKGDVELLAGILSESETLVLSKLEKIAQGDGTIREELMQALLDQHGTGRVRFRNTRATITGFPRRTARMYPLIVNKPSNTASNARLFDALAKEAAADADSNAVTPSPSSFSKDPRIDWLVGLLRSLDQAKVLLICRTQSKVAAIDAALRQRIKNMKMAVFHEGLSLVQRDRNAAWFADEHGASILVCSEIGSEGRNFQFAHHLVLFDIPLDPELLEQRIGRLDRIGQTSEIQVHVPFVAGSSQEVLARWYQEGLNSFENNLQGGRELLERFGPSLKELAGHFHETEHASRAALDRLIQETQAACREITTRLQQGRDRLIELNSFRPEVAVRLVQEIREQDVDRSLDEFMLSVFDYYSIQVEELAPRTYRLGSAGMLADSFPGLPAKGITVTCDRQRALVREDVQFLTWDHPLVTGALDLLLGSEKGNSSFAYWPDESAPGLYLEAIFLLECIAPSDLHVDRFLPPTPLRVLVDHHGEDVGNSITSEMLAPCLKHKDASLLFETPALCEELLPALIERAQGIANGQVLSIVTATRKEMNAQLGHEVARLQKLQKVNRSVRTEEIDLLADQQRALDEHLISARLRLDAIRLIQRG